MTTPITMGSGELVQHSSSCTIGKGWKRMCSCTASIVKCVQSRRLRKQSPSRTISGWDPCPWNSSPWIWLVDYPGPPVAMSMPSVICMLTGYVFCIPLKTKTAEEIVDKYLAHVAFTFGNSRKILSDNGTEFKNTLFEEVAKQLGVERKIYSPVHRPQANGCIEGFHKFLKECISKHMVNSLEWDNILPLAAATYNWFPNEHSKKQHFSHVWVRCGDTFCQACKTKMKIPRRCQRTAKNQTIAETLPNHSLQLAQS